MVGSRVGRPRESFVIKSGSLLYDTGGGARQPCMGLDDGIFFLRKLVPVLYNGWIGCLITYLIEKIVSVTQYGQFRGP